jgi:hypothetical protein
MKQRKNKMPYLYLITRDDVVDYDEYDSYVVCANSPEEAVQVHPSTKIGDPDACKFIYCNGGWYMVCEDGSVDTYPAYNSGGWTTDLDSLKVENIGTGQGAYMNGRVLCSSFNAG